MRVIPLVGIALALIGTSFASDDITVVVHYLAAGDDTAHGEKTVRVSGGQILSVDDLELGDSIEGGLVAFSGPARVTSECRVQTQYETSVTIRNEGPHLDLLDWVHFTSDWSDAKRTRARGFRIPEFSEAERTRFPDVSTAEFHQAVLSRGGEGWADLVTTVESPHDDPAAVDISVIRMRIICGTGATAEVLATIEFQVPMGC